MPTCVEHILKRLALILLCGLLLLLGCTQAAIPPPTVLVPEACFPQPVERVDVWQVASPSEQAMSTPGTGTPPKGKRGRQGREPSPLRLVTEAQRAARIVPTERSFYGASAEVSYAWQPGKIFSIYLSSSQATAISLPKGDFLAVALYLDPEAYEVKNTRLGSEVTGYDVITVRPLKESGSLDTFILGESGRKYLLHFEVGKVAMLSVVFETPALAMDTQEPRLILPRPTP